MSTFVYEPALVGFARVFVEDAKRGVAKTIDCARLARFGAEGGVDWAAATEPGVAESELAGAPADGAAFAELPARAQRAASYAAWQRELAAALQRSVRVTLWKSPGLGELSRPDEGEREFRIRLRELAHERRDTEVAKLRERYGSKLSTLDDRIRRAEARVQSEQQQAEQQKLSTLVAGAASVAGMLLGRRRVSATNVGRVGTAVRSFGRQSKESADIERATESLAALGERKSLLEREVEAAVAAVVSRFDPEAERLEEVQVTPRKGDVDVRRVALAWVPRA